jgi:hypothetical protein
VNWGGSPNPGGAYANHSLSYKNSYSGNVAAAEAIVNGQNILLIDITCKKPGRLTFSGGVSCVDVEPNVGDNHEFRDRAVNIGIFNIDCDYTGAAFNGVGNCVNIQNPNSESDVHDITVANVVAYGGDPGDPTSRPLSNGLFVNGHIPNLKVSNVTVTKAGQSCVMIDKGSGNSLYKNITCVSSGGHNAGSITVLTSSGVTFEGTKSSLAVGGKVFADTRVLDCGGEGNRFDLPSTSAGCPAPRNPRPE